MNIAIASGKGGTGKTTIAASLAAWCAREGKATALLDCDVEEPNANLFIGAPVASTEPAHVLIPKVDDDLCTGCGECERICAFSAIVLIKGLPLVLPEMCHSCGGCYLACPERAIREIEKRIGVVESGAAGELLFAGGRLDHYLYGVKALLKKDIANLLPGHGLPVVSIGHRIIEQTYESLMLKIIGVEKEIPWIEGAKALVSKGLLEEAAFCCDRELSREPENLMAMQLKAYCLTDMGRCEESLALLNLVLSREKDNLYALTATGHALLGLGKYDESIRFFDKALALQPDFQEAQMYKGMGLYLAGKYDEAMDIEVFRTEYTHRIKDEMLKKPQPTAV